jgi:hypothetical protein
MRQGPLTSRLSLFVLKFRPCSLLRLQQRVVRMSWQPVGAVAA